MNHERPDFGTVYSPYKYRETEGIKDATGYDVTGGGRLETPINTYDYAVTLVYHRGSIQADGLHTGYIEVRNVLGQQIGIIDGDTAPTQYLYFYPGAPVITTYTETKTFLVQQQTVSAASALGLDDDEIVGNYTFLAEEE